MDFNITKSELKEYTSAQLNNFFPDKYKINLKEFELAFDISLDRLEHCFKHVINQRYSLEGKPFFNYLYSDHYLMYLWFLSNSVWKESNNDNLASKLYYLNKSLHAFDCMYDTALPDIFLIFHGSGTMLGKAKYDDFFVALQGCTIGSQKGKYPQLGKGVSITAHSSIIGDCKIGDRVTISAYTSVFQQNIPPDSVVFSNRLTGKQEIKQNKECYAKQFFASI